MSYQHYSETGVGRSFRAVIAGVAFAGAADAFAVELPILRSEAPISQKAICELNGIIARKPVEVEACRNFAVGRAKSGELTEEEKVAAISAVCLHRHQARHISFYQVCQSDLYARYEIKVKLPEATPLPAQANGDGAPISAGEACAVGAVTSAGGVILIQGGALVLDFMGCAGVCSAVAGTLTVPGIVIAAGKGCATGIITQQLSTPAPISPPATAVPKPDRK